MISMYFIGLYILSFIGLFATFFYIISLFTYYKKGNLPKPQMDKTVSIIIPAYNEENTIAETIKSALAIDYPKEKLEIIVVNDGSKDNTYSIAKRFISSRHPKISVFTKQNGGKGSALNEGLKHTTGEIVVSMDADTTVQTDALKEMIGYFYSSDVMLVSPSIGVLKPQSVWQRVQQIEYYMGIFTRKSFAVMNAIYITPGAFSAYRKEFFDKYGGYDVGNLTEDLEVALRVQSHGYVIENASKAVVYTKGPRTFRQLLVQRRRWYAGLIKNLWNYRKLFGFRKGPLGAFVLPVAVVSIVLSLSLTIFLIIITLNNFRHDLTTLSAINFQFANVFELNSFIFQQYFYTLFSQPIFIISIIFLVLLAFYIYFSKKQMLYKEGIKINFALFVLLYSFLFTIWWIVSFVYIALHKEVAWR